MNMYIKNFYGNDMIIKKKKAYRDEKNKVINYYEYEFNTDLFNKLIDLNKYSINSENITNIDANIISKYQLQFNTETYNIIEEDDDNEGSIIVDDD